MGRAASPPGEGSQRQRKEAACWRGDGGRREGCTGNRASLISRSAIQPSFWCYLLPVPSKSPTPAELCSPSHEVRGSLAVPSYHLRSHPNSHLQWHGGPSGLNDIQAAFQPDHPRSTVALTTKLFFLPSLPGLLWCLAGNQLSFATLSTSCVPGSLGVKT